MSTRHLQTSSRLPEIGSLDEAQVCALAYSLIERVAQMPSSAAPSARAAGAAQAHIGALYGVERKVLAQCACLNDGTATARAMDDCL